MEKYARRQRQNTRLSTFAGDTGNWINTFDTAERKARWNSCRTQKLENETIFLYRDEQLMTDAQEILDKIVEEFLELQRKWGFNAKRFENENSKSLP